MPKQMMRGEVFSHKKSSPHSLFFHSFPTSRFWEWGLPAKSHQAGERGASVSLTTAGCSVISRYLELLSLEKLGDFVLEPLPSPSLASSL